MTQGNVSDYTLNNPFFDVTLVVFTRVMINFI